MENVVLIRLNERAKELKCLYQVIELMADPSNTISSIFRNIVRIIPPAWQYPSVCQVRITYENQVYKSEDFIESQWFQKANIIVDDQKLGCIEVFYQQFIKEQDGSQFLPEEQKLLNTIALKVSNHIFAHKLKNTLELLQNNDLKQNLEHSEILTNNHDMHWQWRYRMAEQLVGKLEKEALGVVKTYLIGSTKNAEAGPMSDIDLLIHFGGNPEQQKMLEQYIKGWSFCLAEYNLEKTGYEVKDGLIDLHIITDEDIKNKTSYAVMIGSHFNSAREIN